MPKRFTFFSFHYQRDIWRATQVRKQWRSRDEASRGANGFFDASLWEKSQRTNDESLKTLIRNGLKGTSVTCILAGTKTYSRRWVRYEIAQSIVQGNGLLTVHIDWLKNSLGKMCDKGPNPLDHMGIYTISNGAIYLAELDERGTWIKYSDYTQQVYLPKPWSAPKVGSLLRLSHYTNEYCYYNDDGSSNIGKWIEKAASQVGR